MPDITSHPSRRQILHTGAGGIFGLALASLLADQGLLAQDGVDPLMPRTSHFAPRAKNCIFLFMSGGPSQFDLFDEKPKLNSMAGEPIPPSILANAELAFAQKETARLMGTEFQFQRHGQSGLALSELLPNLARCVDDLAMVRTLRTDSFNHLPAHMMMNTGFTRPGRPTLGSWLLYGLGNESRDLPGYIVLSNGFDNGSVNWSSGFLPSNYQGVPLRNEGQPILHLENPGGVDAALQRRSLEVLGTIDREHFSRMHDPEILSRIANYELAFRMQAAAPELLEFDRETPATLAAYGLDRTEPEQRAFSRNCLLARRLVERGVRFVNLYYGDWDAHFSLADNHRQHCLTVDQPIAALLEDLKRRGLLDTTLVVWASEFGRTPVGENRSQRQTISGRDHHPTAFTVWLAGAGIRGGQNIGLTDEIGWNAVETPVHIHDFHATLLHLFGFDHTRLTYRSQGRDFRLTDVHGRVIPQIVG